MKSTFPRKIFTLSITLLSIVGYGFLVFAVAPTGGYTPGSGVNGTLDPDCVSTDTDCFVNVGWKLDPTLGYVYNTTDKIGIGTATPTKDFEVLGNTLITTNHTGLVASELQSLNATVATITPDATVDGSEYYGNKTSLIFDPTSTGNDLTYTGIPITNAIYANLAAQVSTLSIEGVGDVSRSAGLSNNVSVSGSGLYSRVFSSLNSLGLTGIGTITNAQGINNNLYATAGTIGTAIGSNSIIDGDPTNTLTKHITNGTGVITSVSNTDSAFGNNININNTTNIAYGNTVTIDDVTDGYGNNVNIINGANGTGYLIQPKIVLAPFHDGINTTTNAYGFRLDNFLDPTYVALRSTNTYGLYISAGSLVGTSTEYGLYIADAEAENFFVNGLRIGTDSANAKISESSGSATGSITTYIGTNTIDTTAPSDERTKKDIADTTYGLDTLNDIRVVDFKYDQSIIGDHDKQHTGVLAQQVLPLYPEAVGQRSDGYMMVDYKTFIPLLIKSVQDLNLKIATINDVAQATLDDSFKNQLTSWFGDVANNISLIVADTFQARTQICIDDVCINKTQLQEIIDSNPLPDVTPDTPPDDPESDPPPDTPQDPPADVPAP